MAVGFPVRRPCSKGRLRKGIQLRCLRESCVGLIAGSPILSSRGTLRTDTGTVYRVPTGAVVYFPPELEAARHPLVLHGCQMNGIDWIM
ncbi:hypothetical protein DPMN_154566 [Dreissena polymorpha]|uniref:Uncharacterized protein n=1 Tax=Dreissena polymorpha TaxID=45954 RepID=A0A9D4FLB8_DREPO|nr:hypothetical protein DPMN_154563 [Dreissena polymorpha]KAH3800923.1 hypothetical protein DPMN_154566 [Dreissena polymorpha]